MVSINSAGVSHPIRGMLAYSAAVGILLNFVRFIITVRPTAIFTILLLAASGVFGFTVARLYREGAHHKSTFATPITDPLACLAGDLLIGILSLITLIFTWTHNWGQTVHESFLVAYSSTPLMFSMFMHTYLALVVALRTSKVRDLIREVVGDLGSTPQERCAHCSGRMAHDEHDEEQALISEPEVVNTPDSGSQIKGPPSVWSQ